MGQNYYLSRNTVLNMKDQHFEDNSKFPKAYWMILEDSGRFLARIPGVFGLMPVF